MLALQGVPEDELHFGEDWFHGRLAGGRPRAEELLQQHGPGILIIGCHYFLYSFFIIIVVFSALGDGAFLVRKSGNFVGDFSLSFW
jgi:phosphatidylinositol phospholipase C gamma-1